jgi:ATP-dependent DNA helicase RecQ
MVDSGEASEDRKRVERQKLNALLGYCESTTCRHQTILRYFGETHAGSCGNCDNCLEPVATWNATQDVQKALSCVYRTGQRFGVTHLIDVLLGKVTPRVKQYFHEQVSTFGIGAELNQAQWNSIYRQLVAGGYLDADIALHGGLKLVDHIALPVLRGEQEVWLRKETGYSKSKTTKSGSRKGATHPFSNITDEKLWEVLKAQRTELAREQGVPPYVIFHDSTLQEMVKSTPTSLDQFSRISGVGQAKLERYGEHFIKVIQEHLEAN